MFLSNTHLCHINDFSHSILVPPLIHDLAFLPHKRHSNTPGLQYHLVLKVKSRKLKMNQFSILPCRFSGWQASPSNENFQLPLSIIMQVQDVFWLSRQVQFNRKHRRQIWSLMCANRSLNLGCMKYRMYATIWGKVTHKRLPQSSFWSCMVHSNRLFCL